MIMKRYMHLFKTRSEFDPVYNGPDYDEPWLSLTEENVDVNYNKTPPEPPKELTAITFGTITWVTDVPATGGTATKDNCTYTIIARYIGSRPEDITSKVDDVTGELAVEEATIKQRHEAGQLTLSASYCGFTATGNVTVYQEAFDFSTEPLTFNILSDGNVVWAAGNNPSVVKNIEYSLNDGEWTETDSDYYEINVNEGDSIKFRGYNESYGDWNMWTYHGFGSSTCMFTAEGNVMSLIDGDNYQSLTSVNEAAFINFFYNCTGLTSAENLVLPATTLADGCYSSMFESCTGLTTAPALPATTLAQYCYSYMFYYCTSLTTAPELPATTLSSYCYCEMFNSCTSLNYIKCLATDISAEYSTDYWVNGVAPTGTFVKAAGMEDWEIDSTNGIPYGWTVEDDRDMLKLSKTYSLVTEEGGTISLKVTSPTSNWTATTNSDWIVISQVTGNTGDTTITITVPQTDTPRGSKIIFSDETDSVTLNVVEATPLTFDIISGGTIYWNDFLGCPIRYSSDNGNTWNYFREVSINSGDKLMFVADNDRYLDIRYTSSRFANSKNTFFNVYGNIMSLLDSKYFYTATTLTEAGALGELFIDCGVVSAENLILPATTLASYCYNGMFGGCTSLTTAPELPATILADHCYRDMFAGCTSLTTAPELPATTLDTNCYYEMFWGCESLTTAPELLATTLVYGCYDNMFENCANLNYIKCLATDISAEYCTRDWVSDVAPTGIFVKDANMEDWEINSQNGIPEGWALLSNNFSISKETIGIGKSGGNVKLYLNSPYNNWTASTSDSWVNISPSTGTTGITELTITIASAPSSRSGMVTFTDGTNTIELPVIQDNIAAPLTFNILSDGNIVWKATGSNRAIYYNKNNEETWNYIYPTWQGESIYVNAGDKIMFKGDNEFYGNINYYNTFSGSTAKFEVEGNIMSLINSNDFITTTTLTSGYNFYKLFYQCTGLTSAENLILPASTLANRCYYEMFRGCSSLTTAPVLPATTLAQSCYNSMFSGCTSLETAPELHSTTLAQECYSYMFQGCAGLTTAPELPATTLADSCYGYMLYGCTSLTTAPVLPATTLANRCYESMFYGCRSLTTAPELPATTLTDYCYSDMFQGCTALATAPELPATTLASYCYQDMFANCISLTTAPELPATTLANNCYQNMFYGCTGITSVPLNYLPSTTLAPYCYSYMFYNCNSLTEAPELPATTLAQSCYYYMFNGCTSLTTAPELPAITLASSCYQNMFSGCTSLNYIKCLATDISAYNCTYAWVNNVASSGTFVKNPSATTWTRGVNGIPTNWTVVDYDPSMEKPLTFSVISGGTIVWSTEREDFLSRTISYSIDNGETWNSIISTENGSIINVNDGDKVMFKGDNTAYGGIFGGYPYSCQFSKSTAKFELEGNIMSLIDSTNFATATELTEPYTFARMFYKMWDTWDGLLSIENLVLPATTLTENCYCMMFNGCTSLTACTSLPAKTLAPYCYTGMFAGCTSLVNAPELPATTLADGCYSNMFAGCDSLTEAPKLLSTTLAESCYGSMFFNCTSLVNAPELPATTLASGCYIDMFNGCSSLNYIKCLATDISAENSTLSWVNGVASSGYFVKNKNMINWEIDSANGVPIGWTLINEGLFVDNNTFEITETSSTSVTINISSDTNWTITNNYSNISCSQTAGTIGTTSVVLNITYQSSSDGFYTIKISNEKQTEDIAIVFTTNFNSKYKEMNYNKIYYPVSNTTPLLFNVERTVTKTVIVWVNGNYIKATYSSEKTSTGCAAYPYQYHLHINGTNFNYGAVYDDGGYWRERHHLTCKYLTGFSGQLNTSVLKFYEPR